MNGEGLTAHTSHPSTQAAKGNRGEKTGLWEKKEYLLWNIEGGLPICFGGKLGNREAKEKLMPNITGALFQEGEKGKQRQGLNFDGGKRSS